MWGKGFKAEMANSIYMFFLLQKLNAYLEISKILGDYTGLGRAYQTLAQVLLR